MSNNIVFMTQKKKPSIASTQYITWEKLLKAAASFQLFLPVTAAQFGSKSSLPNYSTTFSTAPTHPPITEPHRVSQKVHCPYLPWENETSKW